MSNFLFFDKKKCGSPKKKKKGEAKKQLGDNLLIDANMLNEPGFDWKVVTDLIQHEGHMYRCIGSLAYTVFDNNKIKIISI